MNTFSDNIERMKSRHVLGTVFCLAASVLYAPLAFGKTTDLARQEIPGMLLEQIGSMDIGSVTLGAGNDFTVTRSDGSQYVFENMAQDASGLREARVSVYDSAGMLTNTVSLKNGVVIDDNRVDFEAAITPAGMNDGITVIGSLTGLRSTMYTAAVEINVEGESRAGTIDYSGINDSAGASAPLVTVTSPNLRGPIFEYVMAGGALVDFGIIVVVVLLVAFTCLAFGWWGC